MKAKTLNPLGPRNRKGATDSLPRPGDFPLGSPESRAAARAMLQRKTTLSAYDLDCLVLYGCTSHLHGHAKPDYQWMACTPFYKRGSEVHDALYGPIIPSHLDPEYPRQTFASINFEAIHGRVPQPGDILRYEEVTEMYKGETIKAEVEQIQGAWTRRLPETPCPFRYEDGKMLIHQDDRSWKPDWDSDAATLWSMVEDDALGRRSRRYLDVITSYHGNWASEIPACPAFYAVIFVESEDGKRRVKPFETKTEASIEMPPDKQKSLPIQFEHSSDETGDMRVPTPTMGEHPDKYLARLDIWIAAALPDSAARERRYRAGCEAIDEYEQAWNNCPQT